MALPESPFSGIYEPNIKYNLENYSAAWIMSRKRFLDSLNRINEIGNLEGATMMMLLRSRVNSDAMTRDFLDFCVEHLSAMTHSLPSIKLFPKTLQRIKNLSDKLEAQSAFDAAVSTQSDSRSTNQTVVLIPFSTISHNFSPMNSDNIRFIFLKATIYSLYSSFKYIIVTVGSREEYGLLKDSRLPIWHIMDLSSYFSIQREREQVDNNQRQSSRILQPKYSLLRLHSLLLNSTNAEFQYQLGDTLSGNNDFLRRFQKFKYVFYTESDQIVHFRYLRLLYDAIDESGGDLAMVPHRFPV